MVIPDMNDPIDAAGNAINQQPVYDNIIQAELILPQGDKLQMEKVRVRTVEPNGINMGTFQDTPMMLSFLTEKLRNMLPM